MPDRSYQDRRAGASEPSIDPFPNDAALELGKHAEHLKHRFAYGRGRASWCKSPLDRIQVKNENFCSLVISSGRHPTVQQVRSA